MSETMIIRRGEQQDWELLTQFNIALARETENKTLNYQTASSGVRWLLQHPQSGFYVIASNEGQIVGSLMITPEWSDWRNGFFWWIQSVYVRPEHRGKGIYRRLHEHVLELAHQEKEVCGLRLYVELANEGAQKTYEALGMCRTSYQLFEQMTTTR